MKYLVFCMIVQCFFFCTNSQTTALDSKPASNLSVKSNLMGDSVLSNPLDTIGKMPEIAWLIAKLEKQYPSQRVTLLLEAEPTLNHPYWAIQIGFTSESRFEPRVNLLVKEKNMDILFYDTVKDMIKPFNKSDKDMLLLLR